MPSIPQSLLWISLVVLWLFVLVPMLINKRDAVRRTSDVALATRVLTSGASTRLLKRAGPAAGHRSDPDWRPEDDELEDFDEDQATGTGSVTVAAATGGQAEPDYLDVDVVDEASGAPADRSDAGDDVTEPETEAEYRTDDLDEDDAAQAPVSEAGDGEYEYVEDTSGLEAEAGPPGAVPPLASPAAARRRRYDSRTAAAVRARKYEFRKRVLMAMALVLVLSAAVAFTVAPSMWWLCGSAASVTLLYLAYLRRQTRIEEQVRARRLRRMAHSRYQEAGAREEEFEVVPSRLHRPGAAVLEIDDEDPAFEHLEHASFARDYDWRRDLPRASGQ